MTGSGRRCPSRILGENPSLDQVRTDLNLISRRDDYGVDRGLEPGAGSGSTASGGCTGSGRPRRGRRSGCRRSSPTGAARRSMSFRSPCILPARTEEERTVERFLAEIREEDQSQGGENFTLPEQFEGRELSYRDPEGRPLWALPALGILAAVFYETEEKEQRKRAREKRERELMRDYPEVVSRLTVFLGAGLTVRGSLGEGGERL